MQARAIATGNFDGLHLGHQRIFSVLRKEAEHCGIEPLAVSYHPHTRHFLGIPGEPLLLTPPREKKELFLSAGISLEDLPFDKELSQLPGLEFVRQIILKKLGARIWVFGPNHHFGSGGRGNIVEVRRHFPELQIIQLPPLEIDGDAVSSSRIRHELELGHVEAAHTLLGRPYVLIGDVKQGDARGRQIGFPTANLELEVFKQLPRFGVYAGFAHFEGERRLAVVNIGMRPTFSGQKPSVEVHIPGWSGDLYGKRLEMKLNLNLREEKRFQSVSELVEQITCDVQRARSVLEPNAH